jgi:multidrug resistance efflux pump
MKTTIHDWLLKKLQAVPSSTLDDANTARDAATEQVNALSTQVSQLQANLTAARVRARQAEGVLDLTKWTDPYLGSPQKTENKAR